MLVEHSLNFSPQLPLSLLLLAAHGRHLSNNTLKRLWKSMRILKRNSTVSCMASSDALGSPNLYALHPGGLVEIIRLVLEQ